MSELLPFEPPSNYPPLLVGSRSRPGVEYELSLDGSECSCPGFGFTGHCWHTREANRFTRTLAEGKKRMNDEQRVHAAVDRLTEAGQAWGKAAHDLQAATKRFEKATHDWEKAQRAFIRTMKELTDGR